MSRNLLLGMFLAVLVAGGFLLMGGDDERTAAVDPLRSVDYASLKRLRCVTKDIGEWTMEGQGQEWTLTSPTLADGKPVGADAGRVQRIIGFLRDYAPHDQRSVESLDLGEWGLEPPVTVLEIEDGGGKTVLHFGEVDVDLELYYREAGSDTLFKVGAEIASDLRLDPRHLRHPGLTDATPHLVKRIEMEKSGDGASYALDRVANRWFVAADGTSRRRGDPSLCEQLVTGLAALTGEPVERAVTDEVLYKVSVLGMDDRRHEYLIHGIDEETGGLFARRADEPDVRLTSRDARRWFEFSVDELIDPIFTGFEIGSLSAIVLEGRGRVDQLHVEQKFGRWYVRFYDSFAWRSDPKRMTTFRDALLALKVDAYLESASFEPDFTARFSFNQEGAESLDVVVEVSPPQEDGTRLIRRSDEAGVAVMKADLADVFRTRYFEVMAQDVCSTQTESIDRIAIRMNGEEEYTAAKVDGAWKRPNGESVSSEFLTGLSGRLAYLSVEDYVGELDEDTETAELLDRPLCHVRWRSPERNTPDRPTPEAPGVEDDKWWKLVRRLDDTRFTCVCSIFPRLVFTVDGHDMTFIEDALRGMGRR